MIDGIRNCTEHSVICQLSLITLTSCFCYDHRILTSVSVIYIRSHAYDGQDSGLCNFPNIRCVSDIREDILYFVLDGALMHQRDGIIML